MTGEEGSSLAEMSKEDLGVEAGCCGIVAGRGLVGASSQKIRKDPGANASKVGVP